MPTMCSRSVSSPPVSTGCNSTFPTPAQEEAQQAANIQPEFVQLIREKLVPGGLFHMATDWEHYAEQMLEVLEEALV